MKLLEIIRLRNAGPRCEQCMYFQNQPALVEEAYPGLTAMSSGFASVRNRDGLCSYHELYLSAGDSCSCFASRTADLSR
jgi:hypothetical protein